jgi:hypothetical protein
MLRMMIALGLVGILMISIPTISFAQGTGGATTGCYVDVIRDCAGMAANANPAKPSLACSGRKCVGVLGVLRCEITYGLSLNPLYGQELEFPDVRTTEPGEAGRTGKSSQVSSWTCGSVFECGCDPGDIDCEDKTFLEGYKPVEWVTVGPVDC